MQPTTVHPFFAVPLANLKLAEIEPLNPQLKARLLDWERNEGVRTSVPTAVPKHAVYESDFSLFYRDDPVIARLAQACLNALGKLIMDLNRYSAADMANLRIYHHSWFHVTRNGGYTTIHNHPMASWSGVYCVTPGETDSADPNSGVLRILDARPNHAMYQDPGNAHLAAPYAAGNLPLQLESGQLVLFPSWLQHEVLPYRGQSERITVAFNAWVREAGQPVDEPNYRVRNTAND